MQNPYDIAFRSHAGQLRRALASLGVPPARLDDALQEVFEIMLRRFDEARPGANPLAFLRGIARRVAANHRRRNHHQRGRIATDHDPDHFGGPDLRDRVATRQALARFCAGLDDDACRLFILSEVEGKSGPEIAAQLGCNLNTVYARVRRLKARAREALAGPRRPRVATLLPPWVVHQCAAAVLPCAVGVQITVAQLAVEPTAARHSVRAEVRGAVVHRKHSDATRDQVEADAPEEATPMNPIQPILAATALTTALAAPAPAPAPASDTDADAAAYVGTEGDTRYLEFVEGDHLDGEVQKPDGSLIPARIHAGHASLIDVRPHFISELLRLTHDL